MDSIAVGGPADAVSGRKQIEQFVVVAAEGGKCLVGGDLASFEDAVCECIPTIGGGRIVGSDFVYGSHLGGVNLGLS